MTVLGSLLNVLGSSSLLIIHTAISFLCTALMTMKSYWDMAVVHGDTPVIVI